MQNEISTKAQTRAPPASAPNFSTADSDTRFVSSHFVQDGLEVDDGCFVFTEEDHNTTNNEVDNTASSDTNTVDEDVPDDITLNCNALTT